MKKLSLALLFFLIFSCSESSNQTQKNTEDQSEETKSIKPSVVVENVKQLPTKVSDWGKSEWQKTKDFQKANWEEVKTKWPWNKIFKGNQ